MDKKLYQLVVGPVATNCYLLDDGAGVAAVVDPGDAAERIIEVLEEQKLTPGMILLTHGHFDHIGAVKGLQQKYPGLAVAIGARDEGMLPAAAKYPAVRLSGRTDDYSGLKADRLVAEGDTLTVGALTFEVYDTPGHTRGGVCYRCDDLLFTGDTLFRGDVGRTDLDGGDYPTLMQSMRRLAALEGDPAVLPGHEDASTLERERQHNRYMQEATR